MADGEIIYEPSLISPARSPEVRQLAPQRRANMRRRDHARPDNRGSERIHMRFSRAGGARLSQLRRGMHIT
jgi:hypothetical protein